MSNLTSSTPARLAAACAALVFGTACSSTGSEPTPRVPVQFSVAARPSAAAAAGAAVIGGLRLSVAQAALGAGEEFGCQNCTDNGSDGPDGADAAAVVSVPPGGGAVALPVERVRPGRYAQAEIELAPPAAAPPGWTPAATIEITGSYRGVPFTLPFAVAGVFREALTPPVEVATANGTVSPISVTISLPVASWFVGAGGMALDPADRTARAQIEGNVRRAFFPAETETEKNKAEGGSR